MQFDDVIEITKKAFPEAVASGILPLGGHLPCMKQILDTTETVETFGRMHNFEEAVKEVVGQYLELKAKA